MKRTATFSKCERYRYELWRIWGKRRPFVLFVCLNPSIADHEQDSRTSNRCIRFAQEWGFGALCMANLFAFRSQDPKNLYGVDDPVGPDNDDWLRKLSREADLVVAAWGYRGQFRNRDAEVQAIMPGLHCLGVTKGGCPRHPLHVPRGTELMPWPTISSDEVVG